MKRLLTDIPQQIIHKNDLVLTPLKRSHATPSLNPALPNPNYFIQNIYQQVPGVSQDNHILHSSNQLGSSDFNQSSYQEDNSALTTGGLGIQFHPKPTFYRPTGDSFIYKQMPSFNRISFEDVIEANREEALEGRTVPKYRHTAAQNGQIFEYSNNNTGAEQQLNRAAAISYSAGGSAVLPGHPTGQHTTQQMQPLIVGAQPQDTSAFLSMTRQPHPFSALADQSMDGGFSEETTGFTSRRRNALESMSEIPLGGAVDGCSVLSSSNLLLQQSQQIPSATSCEVASWATSVSGGQQATRRNLPFFGRRSVVEDDDFFRQRCTEEAPYGAPLSTFQEGGCQFQQEKYSAAAFDYNNCDAAVGVDENFPLLAESNLGELPHDYSMQSAQVGSNEDGMSVSSRVPSTGGIKRALKISSKQGTPIGRKSVNVGESVTLKLKKHSSKTSAQGDKTTKSIHRKNKALRVFEEGASVSMDDIDSSSPQSPSSLGTATFVPGSSTQLLGVRAHHAASNLMITRPTSLSITKDTLRTLPKAHGMSVATSSHVETSSDQEMTKADENAEDDFLTKHMIGPITAQERLEKVMRYIYKKQNKSTMKKFCYKCRKQVAEKRLRIKGRFVTRQQAFEILGITYDELKSNEIIQKLLESHASFLDQQAAQGNTSQGLGMFQLNSLFESEGGKKQIKIRNFQALIDDSYNHQSKAQGNGGASSSSMMFGSNAFALQRLASLKQDGTPTASSNAVPEELLRQIHLNLRISTTQGPSSESSTGGGGTSVTKVLISGDSHSSSFLSAAASGGSMFFEDQPLKFSSLRGFENYYVQPLFKVERLIDPKRF